jgi:hypothetical protein
VIRAINLAPKQLGLTEKQCDFEKPCCSRCVKAKMTCTGYDKDLVFVNRTSKSLNVTAATVLSDIRKGKLRSQDLSAIDMKSNLRQSLLDVLSPSHRYLVLRRRAVQLLQKLYLPPDYEDDSNYSQTCWGWVLSISELTGISRALDMSLQSLCVVQCYVHGISASLEQSLDLYNMALQKLREDVEDHELKLSKETLATIIVLSTTEVSTSLSASISSAKMFLRCS